ncbi:MAG: hypothetical protein OZSIB_3001 [Candidatus Ozemobacter sibiricus]|jgi:HEAT repeat protein|uniref:HEAT repeat domain-containing protein n=1 Tax=Candidatus Ozemobacter sibiricus TaxID=2268124 RepID=A0A367ZRE9_9BACT|nr:MAG: hypothetical protein OZSIB_3001 [Candidatus Ozemobacter sibiricus]
MDPYTQKLIESFQRASKDKKLELLLEISRVREDAVLQFLINALGDEHWIVRKTAADCLLTFQEAALPWLSAALNSYNEDIQHWALQVLTRMGSKGAPAILRALKSPNPDVRHFAAMALGEIREPQGIMALIRALGDERWAVRKAASEALVKYGDEVIPMIEQVVTRSVDEDARFWAIKCLGKLGPKAQKILLEALRTGDKQLRYVIAAALGESGDRRVIKVLIDSLADPDWTIRKSAMTALAEIGENAFDLMIESLKDTNEDIRDGCLTALVRCGDKAMARLFAYVEAVDDNQRYVIRKGLTKIGARVVEPLMRLFKTGKAPILSFAAATLGEIGSPKAVPVLIEGLSNPDWNVRRSCAYALAEIGEKGVDRIAEALKSPNDDVRYWVTRILESIGEAGMPYLVRALQDKNKNIRFFAAKALGSSSSPEVMRDLVKALCDPSWSVRKAAFTSICKLEHLSVEQMLRNLANDNEDIRYWMGQVIEQTGAQHLEAIHECLRTGDPELRLCACQALGLIGRSESTDILITGLRDDNEWVRTYAAISLGRIGDPRAIIPLIRGLSDRNSEVHRNIVKAFQNLGPKVFDTLKDCVESDDRMLRRNAAIALGELREERGIDLLIILLEDPEEKVRQAAAEALGVFPGLKAQSVLAGALNDRSYHVRTAALTALGAHGRVESIQILMDHLNRCKDERETRVAKRQLVVLAQKLPQAFIALFKHEAAAVRALAAEALAGVGLPIIPILTEAMNGKDETTVFWCQKVIKRIRNPQEPLSDG